MSTATTRSAAKPLKQPPEHKIGRFAGGVGVCIWINRIETEQGLQFARSITINPRRYFDRDSQQWKDAPSYNPSDLPSLIFALQKAQEYCYSTALPGVPADNGEGPHDEPLSEDLPY
jgi:hypothetical protein